ncbi:hypothetical protein IAQ61_004213 [Plenodomus lingam]|uniref:uncharacterized protein n=1 Tax=Leptosphaeria maculans TaxID=5022 RepID=UPI00331E9C79|nr:hypothetical protein IAQ61_004213 [Plenodomus lingam]
MFLRLLPLLWCLPSTSAIPFFNNQTIPSNLTTNCATALLTDVNQCPPTVASFASGYYYPPSVLEEACTSACVTALQRYEDDVTKACAGQTWSAYDEVDDASLALIPNVMRFNHDLVCLKDADRWFISSTPTPSPCSGKEYQIQSGDDCYKISKSQGIGTAWLLSDNSLTAYCANFPQNGALCIKNTCQMYTVQPADTCEVMAMSHNITIAQLKAWNPVSTGCIDLLNKQLF